MRKPLKMPPTVIRYRAKWNPSNVVVAFRIELFLFKICDTNSEYESLKTFCMQTSLWAHGCVICIV